jgi:hypothetical protein
MRADRDSVHSVAVLKRIDGRWRVAGTTTTASDSTGGAAR